MAVHGGACQASSLLLGPAGLFEQLEVGCEHVHVCPQALHAAHLLAVAAHREPLIQVFAYLSAPLQQRRSDDLRTPGTDIAAVLEGNTTALSVPLPVFAAFLREAGLVPKLLSALADLIQPLPNQTQDADTQPGQLCAPHNHLMRWL